MANRKDRRTEAALQRRKITLKQGKFDPRTYSNGNADLAEANINYIQYVSSKGTKALIYPMPPMLKEKIEESYEMEVARPEPPTYEVETAAGIKETHEHTEDTLQTDEDRAAWDAYVEADAEWETEVSSRFMRALQLECIKPADDDEEWIERQTFLKMHVPENKYERHLHWVETEFIGDAEDIIAVTTIPMRLMGAEEEDIAAAERLFRNSIQEETLKRRSTAG